jgi:hypothetical protein
MQPLQFLDHDKNSPGSPALAIMIIETKAQCPETKLVVAGAQQRGAAVNDMFAYYLTAKMIDAVMLFDEGALESEMVPQQNFMGDVVEHHMCDGGDVACESSVIDGSASASETVNQILDVTGLKS